MADNESTAADEAAADKTPKGGLIGKAKVLAFLLIGRKHLTTYIFLQA